MSRLANAQVAKLFGSRRVRQIAVNGDLCAHRTAQGDHTVIDDSVINLHTVASFAQNFGFVQRVEVLRHIGLRGFDFVQQLTHIFFFLAQAVDDFQAHGR